MVQGQPDEQPNDVSKGFLLIPIWFDIFTYNLH